MYDLNRSILHQSEWPKIEQGSFLSNAVLMSLFTDQRAETLPKNEWSLRGYWADSIGEKGLKVGSKLWTIANYPLNNETLETAIQYAYEALQWLLIDDEVDDIHVDGKIIRSGITLAIEIYTTQGELKYEFDLTRGYHATL